MLPPTPSFAIGIECYNHKGQKNPKRSRVSKITCDIPNHSPSPDQEELFALSVIIFSALELPSQGLVVEGAVLVAVLVRDVEHITRKYRLLK
jgi:hypothetical protein